MNKQKLIDDLIVDEGLRVKPYKCTAGKLTIGIGRNLDDVGITKDEAMYLLINDIGRVTESLSIKLPFFTNLSDTRQRVLANMAFQLGIDGLLKFKDTLAFVKDGDYEKAAKGMLESLWAKQTPNRAQRLAKEMRKG